MGKYKHNILQVLLLVGFSLSSVFCFAENNPKDEKDKDTTVVKEIYKWEYNLTHTHRNRIDMDTSMDFFYLYEPNGSIADYLVNVAEYASPSFSLLFSPNDHQFMLHPYETALISSSDKPDYTTPKPYSNLFYSQGLNSEQTAKFTHTQNINKYCNVGLDLNFYKTMGEYDNQAIKGRHVSPWIVYYGPRFSTTFKYGYNAIERQENGGIAEDSLLNYAKLLRMKFPNASSSLHFQTVDFMQKWNLGRKAKEDSLSLDVLSYKNAIGYKLNYTSIKRSYNDKYPDTEFYTNVLFDSTATNDSLLDKNLVSQLFFEFQRTVHKTKFVADFAVGMEYNSSVYHDYDYSIPEDFTNSEFYEGTFDVMLPDSINISHKHRFYFAGDDKGGYNIYTNIEKCFTIGEEELDISLSQNYANLYRPTVYYLYESNHRTWTTDFDSEKILDLGATISSSWGNMDAEFHYYAMKDYVAFDETGMLQQTHESGNAFTAKLDKTSRFWHIVMKNGLLFQNISVGYQEYPTWATYNSLAFQGAFLKKLIHFGFGGEVLYYPSYKTPTYDASLGDFIPQSKYEYGGFPIINVFATIKYKPIKLYVKYTSLYALLKEKKYAIAGYPQSNGTVSFGISWLFYN